MLRMSQPIALTLALSIGACAGTPVESSVREVGADAQAITPVAGLRRLLVVLVDADASTPVAQTDAEYRQKIFGPGFPNVADYFGAISNKTMTVVEAGLVHGTAHPYSDFDFWNHAQVPASERDSAQIGRYGSLQIAEDAGFDFSQWDFNGDGVIASDELAVLVIDSYNDGGGQTANIDCTQHSGVQVCPTVSLTAHRGELMNYAHELLHQIIGAVDAYGANQSLNVGMTTMGPTGSVNIDFEYYLDPVHRGLAGWETRGVPIIGSVSGSAELAAVADPAKTGDRTILLSHRGAQKTEYLYFEYRRALANTYDQDVVDTGVYVWLTQLDDANQNPAIVKSLEGGDAVEDALFLLAPELCVGDPRRATSRGVVKPLEVGGSYRFRWLDGTDTGLLFHVDSPTGGLGSRSVTWEPSNAAPSCP